jgi:hypothetical protein
MELPPGDAAGEAAQQDCHEKEIEAAAYHNYGLQIIQRPGQPFAARARPFYTPDI